MDAPDGRELGGRGSHALLCDTRVSSFHSCGSGADAEDSPSTLGGLARFQRRRDSCGGFLATFIAAKGVLRRAFLGAAEPTGSGVELWMVFSDHVSLGRGTRRRGGIRGASDHARCGTRRRAGRTSRGRAVSPRCARVGLSSFAVPELFGGKTWPWGYDRKIYAAGGSGISPCCRLYASPLESKERPFARSI